MKPWRTRAQNACTRARQQRERDERRATASAVSRKSVKRGCEAKNCRSNAGISEKSGGLGNAPCVNANVRMNTAIVRSKTFSTTIAEPTAG